MSETALDVYSGTQISLHRAPEDVLEEARKAASALTTVLKSKPKKVMFNGEQYLEREDWGTVAKFYGCTAKVVATRYVQFGDVTGWEADAVCIDRNLNEIGRAESMCLSDEDNWGAVPVYKWEDEIGPDGKKIWDEKKGRYKAKKVQTGTQPKPQFQLRSMAQCVPVRAKILTLRGFKQWNQIKVGELVLAYDRSKDQCEWAPLEAISVYADQPTVRMRSRSLDVTCTDGHTWPVRIGNKRSLAKTRDLPPLSSSASNALILAASAPGGLSPITDEEAAILGWILTDGCLRETPYGKWRIHIDQSKPFKHEIRELVAAVATEETAPASVRTFPTGRTYATQECTRFNLSQEYVDGLMRKAEIDILDRDFPKLACGLSREARAAMLGAMFKGDAHTRSEGNRSGMTRVFGQNEGYVLHTFRILCALEGIALGLPQVESRGERDIEGPFIRQTARARRYCSIYPIKFGEAETQDVWCPTTRHGTWIMELDGQVMITGNTRAEAKALKSVFGWVVVLAGYQTTPAEEMTGNEHGYDQERGDERQPVNQPKRESEKKAEPEMFNISGEIESAKMGKEGSVWFTVDKKIVAVRAELANDAMAVGGKLSVKAIKKGKAQEYFWTVEVLSSTPPPNGQAAASTEDQGKLVQELDSAMSQEQPAAQQEENTSQGAVNLGELMEKGDVKKASDLPPGGGGKKIGNGRAQRLYAMCGQNKEANNGLNEKNLKRILANLTPPLEHLGDLPTEFYPQFEKLATGEVDWRPLLEE